jgi:hypothetical protein
VLAVEFCALTDDAVVRGDLEKSNLAKSSSDSRFSKISRGRVDDVSPTHASFPNKAEYGDRFIPEW